MHPPGPTCTGFGRLKGDYRDASHEGMVVQTPTTLSVRVAELACASVRILTKSDTGRSGANDA